MALFKFTKAILAGEPIQVFNYGEHWRDFTYIDDIVEGIMRVVDNPAKSNEKWVGHAPDPGTSFSPWRIYNIGNNKPIKLTDFISTLEINLGCKAKLIKLPLQLGDVEYTFANIEELSAQFDYKPKTNISDGIRRFVSWYRTYFNN